MSVLWNEERSVSISDGLTNLSSVWFDANKSIENKIEGDFSKVYELDLPSCLDLFDFLVHSSLYLVHS